MQRSQEPVFCAPTSPTCHCRLFGSTSFSLPELIDLLRFIQLLVFLLASVRPLLATVAGFVYLCIAIIGNVV